MTSPTKHPHFSTPPVEYGEQALNSLPQLRNGDQPFGLSSHDEYQSFKRPRLSNTIMKNPSMPKLNNRSRADIPYKTQICLDFRKGGCHFGDNCRFAHGSGEISTLASHWQEELVVKETATFAYMKLCKWTSNGDECPYGNRCHFNHEGVENVMGHLGLYRKSCAVNVGTVGEPKRPVDSSSRAKKGYRQPLYWKTRLCNNWQSTNDCSYGSKCCFAHGQAELLAGRKSAVKYRNLSSSVLAGPAKAESCKTGSGATLNQQVEVKSCWWKEVKKVIGIYADWIDDMP